MILCGWIKRQVEKSAPISNIKSNDEYCIIIANSKLLSINYLNLHSQRENTWCHQTRFNYLTDSTRRRIYLGNIA